MKLKKCRDCGHLFPVEEYRQYRKKDRAGVYRLSMCRGCAVVRMKIRDTRRSRLPITATAKTCRVCGEEKPAGEFYRSNQTADLLRGECRKCFNRARVARGFRCSKRA